MSGMLIWRQPDITTDRFKIFSKDKKGASMMSMLKGGKEMWVVVTTETITAFKDKDEKEVKWSCKTSGLKLEDINADGKDTTFRVFHPDGNVKMYKDQDHVIFHVAHKDTKTAWQASLLRAGVYPVKEKKTGGADGEHLDRLPLESAFLVR